MDDTLGFCYQAIPVMQAELFDDGICRLYRLYASILICKSLYGINLGMYITW